MKPDPDHLHVMAVSLHAVECPSTPMPYDRYSERHRRRHDRLAHLLLNGLANAGYTLTTLEEDS